MDKTARNKWQVRVAALVVFLLGCAAGALALNAYQSWSRASGAGDSRRDRFERALVERLQLSGEQEAQVRQILADTREQMQALRRETEPRFAEVRRQTDERMRQVLTPEQWEKFQQMKDEMKRRRRGGRKGDGNGPPRPEER